MYIVCFLYAVCLPSFLSFGFCVELDMPCMISVFANTIKYFPGTDGLDSYYAKQGVYTPESSIVY